MVKSIYLIICQKSLPPTILRWMIVHVFILASDVCGKGSQGNASVSGQHALYTVSNSNIICHKCACSRQRTTNGRRNFHTTVAFSQLKSWWIVLYFSHEKKFWVSLSWNLMDRGGKLIIKSIRKSSNIFICFLRHCFSLWRWSVKYFM